MKRKGKEKEKKGKGRKNGRKITHNGKGGMEGIRGKR